MNICVEILDQIPHTSKENVLCFLGKLCDKFSSLIAQPAVLVHFLEGLLVQEPLLRVLSVWASA